MRHEDAVSLIRDGVPRTGETWADLGAGDGAFTRALGELLGGAGTVHAVDRDPRVMDLGGRSARGWARVVPRQGDFARPLPYADLDGILMANSLHFIADHERVVARILEALRPGGAFLLVEYDTVRATPWIPFPIPRSRFDVLTRGLGLRDAREVGRIPSRFGSQDIYAAVAIKPGSASDEQDAVLRGR